MTRHRLRNLANWANLSTPLGLVVAHIGGCEVSRGPHGIYLAGRYRFRLPVASAFTIGSVVLTRHPTEWLLRREALLAHEERHCGQYAACLGLPFIPLYLLAALWSQVTVGDRARGNIFERLAGLEEGGYVPR